MVERHSKCTRVSCMSKVDLCQRMDQKVDVRIKTHDLGGGPGSVGRAGEGGAGVGG